MPGQALHQLDCLLCRHVRDNVCWNLDHEGIAQRVAQLDPRLADYVCQGHPDLDEVPAVGVYLFSETELDELVDVAGGLPESIIPPSLKTPERFWLSCDEFFLNSPLCTGEIRSTLGPSEAQRWAELCNGLVARLTGAKLLLAEGIETARQLTHLIRQYLIAMGEIRLVPPPLGTFPTPDEPNTRS